MTTYGKTQGIVKPSKNRTDIRTDHISSFGYGELREEQFGHNQEKAFNEGLKKCVNWDIKEQGILVKRGGITESSLSPLWERSRNTIIRDTNFFSSNVTVANAGGVKRFETLKIDVEVLYVFLENGDGKKATDIYFSYTRGVEGLPPEGSSEFWTPSATYIGAHLDIGDSTLYSLGRGAFCFSYTLENNTVAPLLYLSNRRLGEVNRNIINGTVTFQARIAGTTRQPDTFFLENVEGGEVKKGEDAKVKYRSNLEHAQLGLDAKFFEEDAIRVVRDKFTSTTRHYGVADEAGQEPISPRNFIWAVHRFSFLPHATETYRVMKGSFLQEDRTIDGIISLQSETRKYNSKDITRADGSNFHFAFYAEVDKLANLPYIQKDEDKEENITIDNYPLESLLYTLDIGTSGHGGRTSGKIAGEDTALSLAGELDPDWVNVKDNDEYYSFKSPARKNYGGGVVKDSADGSYAEKLPPGMLLHPFNGYEEGLFSESAANFSDRRRPLYYGKRWYGVICQIDEDFLKKILSYPGGGGFCSISLLEKTNEKGTGVKSVDRLAWVQRFNGAKRYLDKETRANMPYNALVSFTCNLSEAVMVNNEAQREAWGVPQPWAFPTLEALFWSLVNVTKFEHIRLPYFSLDSGHPRSITKVGGRTIYGCSNSGTVVHSAPNLPLGLSRAPTSGYLLTADNLKLVRERGLEAADTAQIGRIKTSETFKNKNEGGLDTQIRGPIDFSIGYYLNSQYAARPDQGIDPFSGFAEDVGQGDNGEVVWVGSLRGITVGTRRAEIVAQTASNGGISPGLINYSHVQTTRGSIHGRVANGDSNIFFVGADGESIFQIFFDENVAGFRSLNICHFGGDYFDEKDGISNVRDMMWDYRRRALWVLYKPKGSEDTDPLKIALFFFSKEYGVMGWSRYEFGVEGANPVALFRTRDNGVGFTTKAGNICKLAFFGLRSNDPKDNIDNFGEKEAEIRSEAEFFRRAGTGSIGPSAVYASLPSYTILRTLNTSQIFLGGQGDTKGGESVSFPVAEDDERNYEFDVTGYMTDGHLPTLKVVHTRDEPAALLSISSRYEIPEG